MNILLASDDNYVIPATVLMESIFQNHRDTDIHIYYLFYSLREESIKKLQKLVDLNANGRLSLVPIDQKLFSDAPICAHFTKEAYFRLLAAACLPEETDRVLYLDPDIVVNGSLVDFYSQSFFENGVEKSFVVCEERELTKNKEVHEKLNLPYNAKYFNSGVLLMNLSKLRREFNLEAVLRLIQKIKDKLNYPDQDLLNVLYYGDVIYDDCRKFNYIPYYYANSSTVLSPDARIVHFAGSRKPWKYGYPYHGKYLYRKYANLSGNSFWLFMSKVKTCFPYYRSKVKKIIKTKNKG